MPALKHIHTWVKYKRRKDSFRCSDPHCDSIRDKEFLIGKASLCTQCGKEFVLTSEDLRRAKPRCINCSNTKEAIAFKTSKGILDNLFKESESSQLNVKSADEYEEKR